MEGGAIETGITADAAMPADPPVSGSRVVTSVTGPGNTLREDLRAVASKSSVSICFVFADKLGFSVSFLLQTGPADKPSLDTWMNCCSKKRTLNVAKSNKITLGNQVQVLRP